MRIIFDALPCILVISALAWLRAQQRPDDLVLARHLAYGKYLVMTGRIAG